MKYPALIFALSLLSLTACVSDSGPQPMSPAERSAKQASLSERIRLLPYGIPGVEGGPGFSRETAWVMQGRDSSVVSQEYEALRFLRVGEPFMQSLVEHEGRWYDVHQLRSTTVEGRERVLEQWFDITRYFKAKKRR